LRVTAHSAARDKVSDSCSPRTASFRCRGGERSPASRVVTEYGSEEEWVQHCDDFKKANLSKLIDYAIVGLMIASVLLFIGGGRNSENTV
jgi:hypothetical protein